MNKSCFLVTEPTIAVVYCHPPGPAYAALAHRFVASYVSNPPDYEHDMLVMCNGFGPTDETRALFAPIPNCRFGIHDNSGYDIGAFQAAVRQIATELVVFFGASSFVPRARWLSRMVGACNRRGLGLFGTMHNTGDPYHNVQPHIRTTGFWLNTDLFKRYPIAINQPNQRYEFEHGSSCLTSWIIGLGMNAWVVNWEHEYPQTQWEGIPNSFHRGDQSGLLVRDRLSEPPYY